MAIELSLRFRTFHRLFQKPLAIVSYQRFSHTVAKENTNSDLLNSFNQDIKAGKLNSLCKYWLMVTV